MLSRICRSVSSISLFAVVIGLTACSPNADEYDDGAAVSEVPSGEEGNAGPVEPRSAGQALDFAGFPEGSLERDLEPGDAGEDVALVYAYLNRFGYFPNDELSTLYPSWVPKLDRGPEFENVFGAVLAEAVELFQVQAGLDPTAVVDGPTRALMKSPRCHHPDSSLDPRRSHKWMQWSGVDPVRKTELKWFLGDFPHGDYLEQSDPRYTRDDRLQLETLYQVALAFHQWSENTPLSFTPTAEVEDADFVLGYYFEPGTDMGREALARTEPTGAAAVREIGFNSARGFHVSPFGPPRGGRADYRSTALHEIGHALGLAHSAVSDSAMYLKDNPPKLHADDKAGIAALYAVWDDLPGVSARDVAVGDDIYVIGGTPTPSMKMTANDSLVGEEDSVGSRKYWFFGRGFVPPQSYSIHRWNEASRGWQTISGSGVRITVEHNIHTGDVPWVVDVEGHIYRLQGAAFTQNADWDNWRRYPGKARDIAAGVGYGNVWIIGTEPDPSGSGDYSVHKWDGYAQDWSQPVGYGSRIAIADNGFPIVTSKTRPLRVYSHSENNVLAGSWSPIETPGASTVSGGASDVGAVPGKTGFVSPHGPLWWTSAGSIGEVNFDGGSQDELQQLWERYVASGLITSTNISQNGLGYALAISGSGNEPVVVFGDGKVKRRSSKSLNSGSTPLPPKPKCGDVEWSCCEGNDGCWDGNGCTDGTCYELPCGSDFGAACCDGDSIDERCPFDPIDAACNDDGFCTKCGGGGKTCCQNDKYELCAPYSASIRRECVPETDPIVEDRGTCHACGAEGHRCCEGTSVGEACEDGSECASDGMCRPPCGGGAEQCCTDGRSQCEPFSASIDRVCVPQSDPTAADRGTCHACGTKDRRCCEGSFRDFQCPYGNTTQPAYCDAGRCQDCGWLNQDACDGTVCKAGEPTNTSGGIKCLECGGLNQNCCAGNSCPSSGGLTCQSGTCKAPPVVSCDASVKSGENEGFSRRQIEMGSQSGYTRIDVNAYNVPDIIRIYRNGYVVAETCLTGFHSFGPYDYNHKNGDRFEVEIDANNASCTGYRSTRWDFRVACP